MMWARIRTQFIALHRYPKAPEEVAFLRDLHRHVFHVTLDVEQFHTERDIEYLMFKQWLDEQLHEYVLNEMSDTSSCEQIALWIIQKVQEHDLGADDAHFRTARALRCEVSEDGENGAVVETVRRS